MSDSDSVTRSDIALYVDISDYDSVDSGNDTDGDLMEEIHLNDLNITMTKLRNGKIMMDFSELDPMAEYDKDNLIKLLKDIIKELKNN